MATLEEARKCPKCDQPGKEESRRPAGRGQGDLVTFICQTTLCMWFGGVCRVVQIRPDGSIPDPSPRTKQYPTLPTTNATRAIDQLNQLLEAQRKPGGEIQGR